VFDHPVKWQEKSLSYSGPIFLDALAPKSSSGGAGQPNLLTAQRAIGAGVGLWLDTRTEKWLRALHLTRGLNKETEQGE